MLNTSRISRYISLILIALSLITLVACGNNQKASAEENQEASPLNIALSQSEQLVVEDSEDDQDESLSDLIQPEPSVLKLQETLRNIAENRTPAVVNIKSKVEVGSNNLSGSFFDFFRPFMGGDDEDDEDEDDENKNYGEALGSGFIISKDGYIVTNYHVVENAVSVSVNLSDEREFEAEIIGVDKKTDTALLKVESEEPLPTVPLGSSSKIEVGDIAVAIGNPFGLSGSFTMGVISAKGRDSYVDKDASFKNYIQTDAPINQGNSGGPLLNIYGEVIGMNTAIYSTTGGSIGIGFAVPIDIVKKVIKELAENGSVQRPMLGVTITNLTDDMASIYKIDKKDGAIVNDIVKGSPAMIAGIKSQDVITKIDDLEITSSNDIVKKIVSYDVGDTVTIELLRITNQTEIEKISLEVTLGVRDEEAFENFNKSKNNESSPSTDGENKEWQGMTLGNVSDYKDKMRLEETSGVVVLKVDRGSNARKKNITKGVVITSINGENINDTTDLDGIKKSDFYMLRLSLGGQSATIVINDENEE